MKRLAFALVAMATALAISPAALADTLQPLTSTVSSTSGTSVSSANLGTWLTTISGVTAATPTGFIATYSESVYRGGADALGANTLNFVFTLTNTGVGADFIDNISISNFGGFSVSEGNLTPATGSVDVLSGYDLGGVVNLSFLNLPLDAGQTADSYVLFTNAIAYQPGTITFQNSGIAYGNALVAGTPEPSSLLLLGTGLLGLAFALFRKNKQADLVLR
jgi:hypothetical protein